MGSRLELHEELCNLLGSRNVYFQPPESVKLVYPCIVYAKSGVTKVNANNRLYKSDDEYQITVIDYDPDSDIYSRIMGQYPKCRFDRSFTSDNLNHDVLTLYH